jgi:hypothetical protein
MTFTFRFTRYGFSWSAQSRKFFAELAFFPRSDRFTAGAWRIARCGAVDCDNACSKCIAA